MPTYKVNLTIKVTTKNELSPFEQASFRKAMSLLLSNKDEHGSSVVTNVEMSKVDDRV